VDATLISASIALKTAANCMKLKSITRSQRIIPRRKVEYVTGTVSIPNTQEIFNKSLRELSQLKITEVRWNKSIKTLGFKLNDGSNCKARENKCGNSHIFDPEKKITEIACIIDIEIGCFVQINFYHH
jgi:hypothetical protein